MLTLARLREVLAYDEIDGSFVWLVANGKNKRVGTRAGHIDRQGYVVIKIDGGFLGHRLAWFYVHGSWPLLGLDHRDGVRWHNWLTNLREATDSQNNANRRRVPNASGLKGVSWDKEKNKWRASIRLNGKTTHLGRFDDPNDAHATYIHAARELFGQFARAE